jgi:hypothetical protein
METRQELKKPNKEDYSIAKAWRPISLLSTLGKILEAVVAERISHAVETYGLLPTNHFAARKQRFAEQALMLLQEQIYAAWRGRRILSLVSFDVKGAYNGLFKERLVQGLRARGIPEDLLRWIEAFCSNCTANIQVYRVTERKPLVLFSRKFTIRWHQVDTKHAGSPCDYTICNSHRSTRHTILKPDCKSIPTHPY